MMAGKAAVQMIEPEDMQYPEGEEITQDAVQDTAPEIAPNADADHADDVAEAELEDAEGEAEPVHPEMDREHMLRVVEAVLFAASEPLSIDQIKKILPVDTDIKSILAELQQFYHGRGVNLIQISGKWTFRTAEDLAYLLRRETQESRRLSKAALETLAIVAYHQPVTRAEIEDIRGVAISKGTLDQLLEMGWVRLRGRRKTPGRPVTYGTTDEFLAHFGLNDVRDLPGMAELKGAGLLDPNLPPDFSIPSPSNEKGLLPDEDPLEDDEEQMALEMDLPEDEEQAVAEGETAETAAVTEATAEGESEAELLDELPEPDEPEELPPLGEEEERH